MTEVQKETVEDLRRMSQSLGLTEDELAISCDIAAAIVADAMRQVALAQLILTDIRPAKVATAALAMALKAADSRLTEIGAQ